MTETLDYLAHLRTESARFLDVLREAPAGTRVPTCPDWDTDDLLWHLGEVQWFWGQIVRQAVTDPSQLDSPERPADRAGLVAFFEKSSESLQRVLAETDPAARRWTWSSEQTAGFTRRRQAQEALMHRVDAELTAGVERAAVDPTLAADGVDEALRVIFGGCPEWGRITPQPGETVRLRATDVERSWLVTLGRFTGTDPEGTAYDEPDIAVHETDTGEDTRATLSGPAADLDCWLWGRPTNGEIAEEGDGEVLGSFAGIIRQGVR